MLLYVVILMLLGGGVAGWMGYRSVSDARNMRARMSTRNDWLKRHRIACETDDENPAKDGAVALPPEN